VKKWESKILETRVADFARAAGAGASTSISPTPPPHLSQAGPSNSQNQYNSNPAYQTPQGLALPGQGAYGVTGPTGAGYGYNGGGYGDVRVKTEPEDMLRIRGGAVSLLPTPSSPVPVAGRAMTTEHALDMCSC
jgi:transcription initiation factor TFIIA large subunit